MDTRAPRTTHPPRLVAKLHRDPPHRHMAKPPNRTRVPIPRGFQTLPAARTKSQIRNDHRHQPRRGAGDALHTKPLQLDRCLDETLNQHEFPLRYVGGVATP